MASSNTKGFNKKKRANRLAKLKQCKLDARGEQWLSQVKSKGGDKEEMNGRGTPHGPASLCVEDWRMAKLKMRGQEEIIGGGSMMKYYSDSEFSPLNSPTGSILDGNNLRVNFSESSRCGSSSSSSNGSNGCGSESTSEGDEGDAGLDGCLDDWEAVADALAVSDKKPQVLGPDAAFESPHQGKRYSFPMNTEQHLGRGGSCWGSQDVGPVPTSCPICCEDLDSTDCSFLPCLCGFRLCLFCHKRILENNGRCPGCRRQYD